MTKERKKEYTFRVANANKTELIVILYEMLLDFTHDASEAKAGEDFPAFREAVRKARGCVKELISSLNFDYELSGRLFSLYRYVDFRLSLAVVKNSAEPLLDIPPVIEKLHEAYSEISRQDTSSPVMENAQTVYAGLTYGRDQLNESLTDQGINRGFRV